MTSKLDKIDNTDEDQNFLRVMNKSNGEKVINAIDNS